MIEKDMYLKKKNGIKLYTNILEHDKASPNIIFIQTPVASVTDLKESYYPLSHYGFNVFALDLSGCGKSEGTLEDFSLENMIEDINTCIDHIIQNYNDRIHFYAGNGMGGMLAQYYLSQSTCIKSFAQYGSAIFGDVSLAKSPFIIKLFYPLLIITARLFPRLKVNFNLIANFKGYKGKNAEKENTWYKDMLSKHPESIHMSIAFIAGFMQMFLDEKSLLKNKPQCPVLVFAPKYDRYMSFSYYQKYYEWLDGTKAFYTIDDSHLSFLWHSEELCKAACEWFSQMDT